MLPTCVPGRASCRARERAGHFSDPICFFFLLFMQDIGKSLLDPTVRTLARATNVTRVNPDAKLLACLFRDCILFVREDRDVKSGRNYRVYHGVRGPHPTPPSTLLPARYSGREKAHVVGSSTCLHAAHSTEPARVEIHGGEAVGVQKDDRGAGVGAGVDRAAHAGHLHRPRRRSHPRHPLPVHQRLRGKEKRREGWEQWAWWEKSVG